MPDHHRQAAARWWFIVVGAATSRPLVAELVDRRLDGLAVQGGAAPGIPWLGPTAPRH